MRRKDREMDKHFALAVADKCEYAVISMANDMGMPYCVPVTIARDGQYLYFHCAKEGEKINILTRHPHVCVACVGDTCRAKDKFTTAYESAIIKGTACEVKDDEEKIHALRLICERHTPTNMEHFDRAIEKSLARTGVWRIEIQQITGKHKKLRAAPGRDKRGEHL